MFQSFNRLTSSSSKIWLRRQRADPYVKQRDLQGYRSRSAFKLLELNEKHHFLYKGAAVVDLGGAPGGWSQVAAKIIGRPNSGKLVCVDLLEVEPIFGVDVVKGDFLDSIVQSQILSQVTSRLDVVLSDMAPSMSGQVDVDMAQTRRLYEAAIQFSIQNLAQNGTLVMKFFTSPIAQEYGQLLDKIFRKVTIVVKILASGSGFARGDPMSEAHEFMKLM